MEPVAKKQKTEDGPAEMQVDGEKAEEKTEDKEQPKAPEPPKELEGDAAKTSGPKVKDAVTFLTEDTTMNVMLSTNGNLLKAATDGGIRYLLAGARANVGLKSGRYMFEARILETVKLAHEADRPTPRCVLRIGFSTAGSPLLMGNEDTSICFDSEGGMYHGKQKTNVGCRFGCDNVMAVLLNLDTSSPNSNTISLFKDGKRACEPQALPENLRGKTLYPTLTYRNYAVHVNFGPQPMEPLPFTCTMVQEAATKDSAVTTSSAPKDGKYEVVFPVCLPDEGGFDWLDMFKAKCPNYTELSDRMILDWAQKSGLFCSKSGSNDKPDLKFGIQDFDDAQVRRMISALAPLQQRNYVVMEVQGNLMKDKRTPSLSRFYDSSFKKVANVILGEPGAEYKKKVQQLLLADKQATSDAQFKLKKAAEAKLILQEKQKKALQKAKRKADKEREKQAAELRKKEEKEKKEAERKKAAEEGKELPEEEPEEEKKAEEVEDDEEEEEVPDEPMVEEDPPKVELTAEEKKLSFRKLKDTDVALFLLNTTFQKFSIPEKDEGFNEIRHEWNKNKEAAAYLKKWIFDRKQTSRVEDLVPSSTFKAKWAAWQKNLQTWKRKQNEYKAKLAKKMQDKAVKAMKKINEEKLAAAKTAAEEATKEEAKDGEEAKEETKEDAAKDEDEAKDEAKSEQPEPMDVDDDDDEDEVDFDGVDIFGVEEVDDIGKGMPLYKDFEHEDWVLMSLTFELHLMVHSFKQDCNDDERLGISLEHLGFYYQKYYGQFLDNRTFGKDTMEDLVSLARDVVYVNQEKVLASMLDADIEYPQVFAKIAEEGRRHRALLVDVGEESAKLKIARPKVVAGDNRHHDRKGGMKGVNKGFDKGRDKGFNQAGFQSFARKGFDKGYEKGGFGKGFDKGFEKGGFKKGFDKGFDKGFGKKKHDQGKGKSHGCKGSFKGGK